MTWPDIRPPKAQWQGGRLVTNEKHSGERALLVFDDRKDQNVEASYEPLVPIPEGGLRLRFWYRTAVPEQVFLVTLNHHDASGKWISGGNNDIGLDGNGQWQEFDRVIEEFPNGAKSVQLRLRAARWTETGEGTGLVWFDDVSLTDAGTGRELLEGGGFEPPELPQVEQEKLQVKLDFTAWDKAMERAIDHYGFNSFRLGIPGMGGGTFHSRDEPELLGFGEDTPHYKAMFNSYCSQIQEHLRAKGWLDEAFVYWFDEPDPKDYAFVNNGFAKLKAAAPDISRMLTEQVEPALIGGPNIWCPISDDYRHEPGRAAARARREVLVVRLHRPEGPLLHAVHRPPRRRSCASGSGRPGSGRSTASSSGRPTTGPARPPTPIRTVPQNPYEDPMGWTSGYSTPAGQKRPWGNGDGRFIYPPVEAADGAPARAGARRPGRQHPLGNAPRRHRGLRVPRDPEAVDRGQGRQARRGSEELATPRCSTCPREITKDMTTFTKDPGPIEQHRDRIARAIAELSRD